MHTLKLNSLSKNLSIVDWIKVPMPLAHFINDMNMARFFKLKFSLTDTGTNISVVATDHDMKCYKQMKI